MPNKNEIIVGEFGENQSLESENINILDDEKEKENLNKFKFYESLKILFEGAKKLLKNALNVFKSKNKKCIIFAVIFAVIWITLLILDICRNI